MSSAIDHPPRSYFPALNSEEAFRQRFKGSTPAILLDRYNKYTVYGQNPPDNVPAAGHYDLISPNQNFDDAFFSKHNPPSRPLDLFIQQIEAFLKPAGQEALADGYLYLFTRDFCNFLKAGFSADIPARRAELASHYKCRVICEWMSEEMPCAKRLESILHIVFASQRYIEVICNCGLTKCKTEHREWIHISDMKVYQKKVSLLYRWAKTCPYVPARQCWLQDPRQELPVRQGQVDKLQLSGRWWVLFDKYLKKAEKARITGKPSVLAITKQFWKAFEEEVVRREELEARKERTTGGMGRDAGINSRA